MTNDAAPRVIVIVPAAGSGMRFGGDVPKQFQLLAGKPIVQRVVERFLLDERVESVIVPVSETLLAALKRSSNERVRYVAGGVTRLQSVSRGLEHAGECDLIAVHDAVRPFFSLETFHAALAAAGEHGASLPVLPLADTVHVVRDGAVVATLDRSELAAAQTPQCFRPDVLRDIVLRASRDGDDATDEAGLAARYGYTVRTVPGDVLNFKITRHEDLAMAEHMMAGWGGGG